jgi:hypothetical protein
MMVPTNSTMAKARTIHQKLRVFIGVSYAQIQPHQPGAQPSALKAFAFSPPSCRVLPSRQGDARPTGHRDAPMNADSADHLVRLFGQERDVVWWIVGIVFRHVPDMAAITAAAVVDLCVFAQSRKPLNMIRSTDRTSGVGHRGRIRENPFR